MGRLSGPRALAQRLRASALHQRQHRYVRLASLPTLVLSLLVILLSPGPAGSQLLQSEGALAGLTVLLLVVLCLILCLETTTCGLSATVARSEGHHGVSPAVQHVRNLCTAGCTQLRIFSFATA